MLDVRRILQNSPLMLCPAGAVVFPEQTMPEFFAQKAGQARPVSIGIQPDHDAQGCVPAPAHAEGEALAGEIAQVHACLEGEA
jgi:hypothetical protein